MVKMQRVTYQGGELEFIVNGRGVIDATHYFHNAEYQRGGTSSWTLSTLDVRGILLHHTAGYYGAAPPTSWRDYTELQAVCSAEFGQLVSMARDHHQRYGIGPAYNLAVFGSGNIWAIGRHGTHRAHTAGREPASRVPWNHTGRAVVVFGNYETEQVTTRLARAIRAAVAEVRTWPGVRPDAPVHEHGLAPTVDSAGVRYAQQTACPGRHIAAWRAQGGLLEPDGVPSYQPDRWGEGYTAGYRQGYGQGAAAAGQAHRTEHEEAVQRVAALVTAPPVPHVPPTPALAPQQVAS